MLSYETAVKLKEAGYKMPEHDFDFEMPNCHRCDYENEKFCVPSLSELIEACGDKLENLYNESGHWKVNYKDHDVRRRALAKN